MVFVLISRLNKMFNHFVESIKCCRKQLHCSQHNFSKKRTHNILFFFLFCEKLNPWKKKQKSSTTITIQENYKNPAAIIASALLKMRSCIVVVVSRTSKMSRTVFFLYGWQRFENIQKNNVLLVLSLYFIELRFHGASKLHFQTDTEFYFHMFSEFLFEFDGEFIKFWPEYFKYFKFCQIRVFLD